MSTTSTKRPHAAAKADAAEFYRLFPAACFARWSAAGSLRRRCPEVGDVEHVVIPAFGELAVGGTLFAQTQRVNLLWHHLDALVSGGVVTKHLYGATGYRWGEKYRGVDFRGHLHELFACEADNWGPTLAIRTGPAEFSKGLVTGLRRNGNRNVDGYVWRCNACFLCGPDRVNERCQKCQGTDLEPIERLSVPDEEAYFKLAGMAFVPPEKRF